MNYQNELLKARGGKPLAKGCIRVKASAGGTQNLT